MAQAVTGLSQVAAPVNYVLMRGLLRMARQVLPYFNGTVPGELMKNEGSMSVKWRRYSDLATVSAALGEVSSPAAFGLGRTSVQPSVTDLTVAIAKYGNAIIYDEELDLFNVNTRAASFMTLLGRNAGESLNLLMRNVFDGESVDIYSGASASSLGTVKAAISSNNVKSANNILRENGAYPFFTQTLGSVNIGTSPIRESFFGICHVDMEEDIRAISGFVGVEKYAGQTATKVGEFGTVNGVRWCSTRSAPIQADSGAAIGATGCRSTSGTLIDVYTWFVYGEDAVGSVGLGEEHVQEIYEQGTMPAAVEVINKPIGSSGIADMFNEVGSLAWKAWFAGKVLNSNWIVKGYSGASKLTD